MPTALRRGGRKSRNVYTAPQESRFAGLGRIFSTLRLPGLSRGGGNGGGTGLGRGVNWRNLLLGLMVMGAEAVTVAGLCAV
ncbi:hypothetical protein, partial [Desulfovibrio sp.]|uniref:hypothetical protein n=1 Tax=Desulfovibrio sp. TaxID=885 RepID=UPI0023CB4627